MHRVGGVLLATNYLAVALALAVATLLGGVALAVGRSRLDGLALWLLGLTTGAWLVVDSEHEFRVLWRLTAGHGLTAADLAAGPAVLLAVALLLRRRRRPARAPTGPRPAGAGGRTTGSTG